MHVSFCVFYYLFAPPYVFISTSDRSCSQIVINLNTDRVGSCFVSVLIWSLAGVENLRKAMVIKYLKCSYCFSSEPETNTERALFDKSVAEEGTEGETSKSETVATNSQNEEQNTAESVSVESGEESLNNSKMEVDSDDKSSNSIQLDEDSSKNDETSKETENRSEEKASNVREDIQKATKQKELLMTPSKYLSPKQKQKKLESEKKRLAKQKEREERELERLRLKREKQEQKQKEIEQKQKEKELKEEQKKKEKEEKEQKRKEKEEKEEQKRKEKQQEKLKRQLEIDEKNKEKQKMEEQKQKAAAAFANFFVPKKTEEKRPEESSLFMPFEVKSDMRLAPITRNTLGKADKIYLDEILEKQDANESYINDVKNGKKTISTGRTWPYEDANDDVLIVEENLGESIMEQKSLKMRAKFFSFHENQRPPYFGTWRKKSKTIRARKPLARDSDLFNYEIDSDDEWEEEDPGESLRGSDDEDKENESGNEYEVDNEFFVPHGHLSDDEVDEEEKVKFSPESHKAKLKLLKNEFDEEMKSKTLKIKPRIIGCIWYDKAQRAVEEAIDKYLQPLSIICNGPVEFKKRSDPSFHAHKTHKLLPRECVPMFLKFLHGNRNKRKVIAAEFAAFLKKRGVNVKQSSLFRQAKEMSAWEKSKNNKMCWVVSEDVMKEFNVNLTLPN